jgi:hypothetical protein
VATGGGLGAIFGFGSAKVAIPVSEVSSIGYTSSVGSDWEPAGFYVQCGFWKSKVVLPGLNREQAKVVTDAILRRVPEIGSKMPRKN